VTPDTVASETVRMSLTGTISNIFSTSSRKMAKLPERYTGRFCLEEVQDGFGKDVGRFKPVLYDGNLAWSVG
jgi:hypothetical protein